MFPRIVVNQEGGIELSRRLTNTRVLPLQILKDRTDEYGTPLSLVITPRVAVPTKTICGIVGWFIEENLAPDVKILDEERGALIIRGSFSGNYPQLIVKNYVDSAVRFKVVSHRQSGGGYSLDLAIDKGLVITGKTFSLIIQHLGWTKSHSVIFNGSDLSLSLLK